jgi:hypothetical protein
VLGGGEVAHVSAGLGEDDLGGELADPRDRVQVIQVLLMVCESLRDPLAQGVDEGAEVVDLIEVVPDHKGVVLGEVSIQRLDQFRYLAASLAASHIVCRSKIRLRF